MQVLRQHAHFATALFLAVCHGAVLATPLPDAARAEVIAVLDSLASSGCQFERNGSWYGGTEARAHLLRKLDYVEGRANFRSAEEFIDRAASTSSTSGQPYRVKCGNAAAVESGVWLRLQLQEVRARTTALRNK
jgi:hypothetical protein